MTKTSNKFNSLAQIKFVEDIDQEAAANYGGGRGRINDGNNDPDLILYENINFGGASIQVNAAIGDGIPYVGNAFNDRASSLTIRKGTWILYQDSGYDYRSIFATVGPGTYNFTGSANDILSGLFRVS